MGLSDSLLGRTTLAFGLVPVRCGATRTGRGLSRSTPSCHCVLSLLPRGWIRRRTVELLGGSAAFASLREARPFISCPSFFSRGYIWVRCALRPAVSRPRGFAPQHPGSASAGHLAVSRREPRYPFRSTFLRGEL